LTGTSQLFFESGSTFNDSVTASAPLLYLNGSRFNGVAHLTNNGSSSVTSTGGCYFKKKACIYNSCSTSITYSFSTTAIDTFVTDALIQNNIGTLAFSKAVFLGSVTLKNSNTTTGSDRYYVSSTGQTIFKGAVTIDNSTSGMVFGNTSGVLTLDSSASLSFASGFTGNITIKGVTQLGSSAQNFTFPSASSKLILGPGNIFNGPFTYYGHYIQLNGSTFNSIANITRYGTGNDICTGGNVFNATTVLRDSSGHSNGFYLANVNGDDFKGDVTFVQKGTGVSIYPSYNANSTFAKNVTVDGTSVIAFGQNGGKVIFSGTASQSFYSSSGYTPTVKKMQMDKITGNLSLQTKVVVSDSLILNSGVVSTDSLMYLSLLDNTVATSGNDSSFISGQLEKIGDDAFTFPIGFSGISNGYNPISISAPSSTSDKFQARYIFGSHGLSLQEDSIEISNCEYWILNHPTGSTVVSVSLGWNRNSCKVSDADFMNVMQYSGTSWSNLGKSELTRQGRQGKIKSSSTSSISTGNARFAIGNTTTAIDNFPYRGMYIDKFIITDISGAYIEAMSILGYSLDNGITYPREDRVLEYAKENHILYLLLYDFRHIYSTTNINTVIHGMTLKDHLCRFIEKAKTEYCIQQMGVSIEGGQRDLNNVNAYVNSYNSIVSPSYTVSSQLRNSGYYDSKFDFIQTTYNLGDSLFQASELIKTALRVVDFISTCSGNIDVVNIEYEYWNQRQTCPPAEPDKCAFQTTPYNSSNYVNYVDPSGSTLTCSTACSCNKSGAFYCTLKSIIEAINSQIISPYNSTHTTKLLTEIYLGDLDLGYSGINDQLDVARHLDGVDPISYPTYRPIDRILLHHYWAFPKGMYFPDDGTANQNYSYRWIRFKDNTTGPNTMIHPILSMESLYRGGVENFLGWYFDNPSASNYDVASAPDPVPFSYRNIFTTEQYFYDDAWNQGSAPNNNVITPGACQWFSQSFMIPNYSSPITFQVPSPYCSSIPIPVAFDYTGPIESGIPFQFQISGPGVTYSATGSTPTYIHGTNLNFLNSLIPSLPTTFALGTYTATLSLNYGTNSISQPCSYIYSKVFEISAQPKIESLSNTSFCEGGNVILKASGVSGGTYQWLRDGIAIVGATSNEYIAKSSGRYTCSITGSVCNGISTNYIDVLVNPNPQVFIQATCGDAITGQARLTALPATSGTYTWNKTSSGSPITSQYIDVTSKGNYQVIIDNGNGCTNSASLYVTQDMLDINTPIVSPTFSVSPSSTYCQNLAPSNVSISISNSSNYESIIWAPSGCFDSDTTFSAPINTTHYYVFVKNSTGCSMMADQIITVNPTPNVGVTSSNSGTVCAGQSISLTANNASSYTWSPSISCSSPCATGTVTPPTGTTTVYTVTGTDGNGCTATATKSITTYSAFSVTASSSNTGTVCAGDVITLSSSNASSYSWSPSISCTGTCSSGTVVPPAGTTTVYTVTGTDGNGCTSSATKSITVYSLPSVVISSVPSNIICSGSSATLDAGSGFSTYSWSTGQSTRTISVSSAGSYTCTITNSNGCSASAATTVTVNPLPTVSIGPSNPTNCLNSNITLTASGANTYVWVPYGTCTSPCSSITVNPVETTSYTVVGTSSTGCTGTATVSTVKVNCCTSGYGNLYQTDFNSTGTLVTNSNLDSPVSIANGVSITITADVTISPNVTITINSGGTLTLDGANLSACGNMWGGIINNGGTVIIKNGTFITDAITAVDINGGSFNITGSTFDNNFVSLSIRNGTFTQTGTVNNITGNIFKNNGAELTKLPYLGGDSPQHIYVINATGLHIGEPGATPNAFTQGLKAIHCISSTVIIQNNTFDNIGDNIYQNARTTTPPPQFFTPNSAIYSKSSNLTVGSTTGINYFTDCQVGVYCTDNNSIIITENDFERIGQGVYVTNSRRTVPRTIDITHNVIDDYLIAIDINDVYIFNVVNITDNKLNEYLTSYDPDVYGTSGILVQNLTQSGGFYNINNNIIKNTQFAIHLTNLVAGLGCVVCPPDNQNFGLNVSNNTITQFISSGLVSNSNPQVGIWLDLVRGAFINSNEISWSQTPSSYGSESVQGIRLNKSIECKIKENVITNMVSGLMVFDDCSKTNLFCNSFDRCYIATCFSDNSFSNVLTNQGKVVINGSTYDPSTSYGWKNDWISTSNSKFASSNGNPPFYWIYKTSTIHDYNPGSFPSYFTTATCANEISDCDPQMFFDEKTRDYEFAKVAYDIAPSGPDSMKIMYTDKETFYRLAKKDSALYYLNVASDSVYLAKYNEIKASNIGKFEDVKELILKGEVDSAKYLSATIVDSTTIESNNKMVASLYFDKYAKDTIPDSTSLANLYDIAHQHPFEGGDGVYSARAMLHLNIIDLLPPLRKRGINSIKYDLILNGILYPNPTSNTATFQYLGLDLKKHNEVRLFDITGRLIKVYRMNSDSIELPVSNLVSGMYYVKFSIDGVLIESHKLAIEH